MSLAAVQALILRANSDPEFTSQLKSSPDQTLSQFDLTEEERKAILDRSAAKGKGKENKKFEPFGQWV